MYVGLEQHMHPHGRTHGPGTARGPARGCSLNEHKPGGVVFDTS